MNHFFEIIKHPEKGIVKFTKINYRFRTALLLNIFKFLDNRGVRKVSRRCINEIWKYVHSTQERTYQSTFLAVEEEEGERMMGNLNFEQKCSLYWLQIFEQKDLYVLNSLILPIITDLFNVAKRKFSQIDWRALLTSLVSITCLFICGLSAQFFWAEDEEVAYLPTRVF